MLRESEESNRRELPIKWIILTVLFIASTGLFHILTRSQLVYRSDITESGDILSKLDKAQTFVKNLEAEVLRLESGDSKIKQPSDYVVPKGGGLPLFSHSKHDITRIGSQGQEESMIDIVVRANVSNYEKLRQDSSEPSSKTASTTNNAVSPSASTGSSSLSGDPDNTRWEQQLTRKLRCAASHRGGIFLYHVRKAAGTSVKDVLHHASTQWRIPLYETEGLSLDPRFLVPQSLLSVLTMRNPVERVMSMYWYEHVGWYDGILHQPEKCKTLSQWVNAWRDGSEWKKKFLSANPRSVYVEIENYYIKMLIGWTGAEVIGGRELEQAKTVLRHFDIVLVLEWMQDARQIDAMNALFPNRGVVAAKHMLRGDHKAKARLKPRLAHNEAEVKATIAAFNSWDMLLWDFAQSLLARRLKVLHHVASSAHKLGRFVDDKEAHSNCGAHSHSVQGRLDRDLLSQLGIFRPPGHKGPF